MLVNRRDKITAVFGALADPTRRRILTSLSASGEAQVTELAKPFRVSLPAISRHLRVLEKAKLIDRKRRGRLHVIRLRSEGLKQAQEWMRQCAAGWDHSFDTLDALLKGELENQVRNKHQR